MKKLKFKSQNSNSIFCNRIIYGVLIFIFIFSLINFKTFGLNSKVADSKAFKENSTISLNRLANPIVKSAYAFDYPRIIINESSIENYTYSGSGENWDDPYIINNLPIGSELREVIQFQEISKFLIIQNIGIEANFYNLIFLKNCSNIKIENCFFTGNQNRDLLLSVDDSINIEIENCTFSNSRYLLNFDRCDNITLKSSLFLINLPMLYFDAILIFDSNNIQLLDNSLEIDAFVENDRSSVFSLFNSNSIIVTGNNFYYEYIRNYIRGNNTLIKNNYMSVLYISGNNLTVLNNYLDCVDYTDGQNSIIQNNYFQNAISQMRNTNIFLENVYNMKVENNTFNSAKIGIQFLNVFNFSVTHNIFYTIDSYVFLIFPYTMNVTNEFLPVVGTISYNIIIFVGQYVHNQVPGYINISWNLIVPQFGFLVILIFTLIWFSQFLPEFVRSYKFLEFSQKAVNKMDEYRNTPQNSEGNQNYSNILNEYYIDTKMLHLNEIDKFKTCSFSIASLIALYLSITLIEIDNNNLLVFPNISPLFMAAEFIIIGLIFNKYLKEHLKELKDRPKILRNREKRITINKNEKKKIKVFIFGLSIIGFIIFGKIKGDNFSFLLLLLGLLFILFFLVNLRLKYKKNTPTLYWGFLFIGLVLFCVVYWVQLQYYLPNGFSFSHSIDIKYSNFYTNKLAAHVVLLLCILLYGIHLVKNDKIKIELNVMYFDKKKNKKKTEKKRVQPW